MGVFFAALVIVTFPVLLKPLAAEFGWSREAVARAFGIGAAAAALGAAGLGVLLDRVDPRRVVVPALVLLGLGFASLAVLTPNLAHLYALYALLGLAGIGTSPVAYGRTVATWFDDRRGLALALVITGGALGGMIHPPALEALSRAIGWRGACVVLGGAVIAIGVPTALRFVRVRPAARATADGPAGEALHAALRSPLFWVLVAVQFCGTMAQNAVIVHLAALLTDRGFTAAQGAIGLAAMAGAAVLGRLLTGFVIDRTPAARVLVVLMAIAAGGAFVLAGATSFPLAVGAAMLVGLGTGGEADIVPYLLSRYFGLRAFSGLFGIAWMVAAAGGALGPIVMGRAFDQLGSYEAMLVRLSVVVVAAAALALVLPRPGPRKAPVLSASRP